MPTFPFGLLACFAAAIGFLFAGCGKGPESVSVTSSSANSPMEADLARTLKAQADFYVSKPAADLPANLKWEDGADLPEFADPKAKKGGTLNYFLTDFPRTIRTVGPDATGGIRRYLLDFVEPYFVHPHPNVPGAAYPGLARQWAHSAETKTVYYRLDPKARWSDGRPVTTDDVVFTFYFMRSPHHGGVFRPLDRRRGEEGNRGGAAIRPHLPGRVAGLRPV